MSQDINTKEIYDCEGCREKDRILSAMKKCWCVDCGATLISRVDYPPQECPYCRANRLMKLNKELQNQIASLQQQLTETNELCEARLKNIIILKKQLTEAQGKRGKVVSVEEIANLIMFGFNSQPWSLVSTFENSGEVVNIATAIHKALYGSENA
jgi:DNA-directed RNA polymerase subunit RPC12/RpoP